MDALLPRLPESLKMFQPSQTFFLLDKRRCTLKDVLSCLVPCYFMLNRTNDFDKYVDLLLQLSKLVRDAGDPELARMLDEELKRGDYLRIGLPVDSIPELIKLCEDPKMIKDRFALWEEKFKAKGRVEGRMEGRVEGEARGLAKGRVEGESIGLMKAIANLMDYMNVSVEKAMDMLRVPQQERSKLTSMMSL